MTEHPWHPAFVHFPLACWVLAAMLDIATHFFSIPAVTGIAWPSLAQALLWGGTILALPAMLAGIIDYSKVPATVQDSAELLWHISLMTTAWMLFLGAAIWRVKSAPFDSAASWGITIIELAGVACLIVGGRFAATVVFKRLPAAQDAHRVDHRPHG